MRIAINIPVYGRPALFEFCALRLINNLPSWVEVDIVAILSPGDPDIKKLYNTCKDCDLDIVLYKNKPLGEKLNSGVNFSLRKGFDYFMSLGSDNILAPSYWGSIKPHLVSGAYALGFSDLVIFNTIKEESYGISLNPETSAQVWGAGRVLSKEAVSAAIDRKGWLYNPRYNRGLDTNSQHNIFGRSGKTLRILGEKNNACILDIKNKDNINEDYNLERWEVDNSYVKEAFGICGKSLSQRLRQAS